MLSSIRNLARRNLFLRKLIGYHLASSGLFDRYFSHFNVPPFFQRRINLVLESPDLASIPTVKDAGKIKRGKQVMHNGLKIHLGSYYGPEVTRMLLLSKGIHEPQEERVFMEVLPTIPENGVMIEMGAYWGFYSMWFQQQVKGAKNYLIEPDAFNMGQGQRNFRLNRMKGEFIQAFIGDRSEVNDLGRLLCIDDFVMEKNIPFIHMLHSDIQGFEYDMLQGAQQTIDAGKVGYIFISTHSNELHNRCVDFLLNKKFIILANANLNESYSEDGLIAARAPYFPGIGPVPIARRQKTNGK